MPVAVDTPFHVREETGIMTVLCKHQSLNGGGGRGEGGGGGGGIDI